jgi:predicted alpha/beta-hydrolase family hydrolase
MRKLADALTAHGLDVVTFDFPYMEQKRKAPDRAPVLEACYASVIETVRKEVPPAAQGLFIGGQSMGGRMATQLAASSPNLPIAGIVLFGYPLHPPGKPEQRRDKHLPLIRKPMFVVQGSRDAFGTPDELMPILEPLTPEARLHVIDGGDHSFKVGRGGAGRLTEIEAELAQAAAGWMFEVMSQRGG